MAQDWNKWKEDFFNKKVPTKTVNKSFFNRNGTFDNNNGYDFVDTNLPEKEIDWIFSLYEFPGIIPINQWPKSIAKSVLEHKNDYKSTFALTIFLIGNRISSTTVQKFLKHVYQDVKGKELYYILQLPDKITKTNIYDKYTFWDWRTNYSRSIRQMKEDIDKEQRQIAAIDEYLAEFDIPAENSDDEYI